MDESKRKQKCGQILILHKKEDGEFDLDAAFNELVSQFGVEKEAKGGSGGDESGGTPAKKSKNKRKADADAEEPGSPTKVKKSETFENEENREVGAAFLEIAGLYYKAGESLKGGVYSKAAKALRETPAAPKTKKEAMALKLKGIGKGTAEKIEEFYTTGKIQKLEEMRAQNM